MRELIANIASLDQTSTLLEEVIILNNASTENYEKVITEIEKYNSINFKLIQAKENLGVAKGRNFALKFVTASIVVLIDDDAIIENKDALKQIFNSFNQSKPSSKIAVVSFKVLYYDTLKIQINAFPHKKFDKYKNKSSFYTYYYAGGAHAIKKEVLDDIGNYPEDFFYGMEEYDLSYRILDKGYNIMYINRISVLHKESPLGRKPKKEKLMMMWINKSKVAYRYLPKKYFYSTAFIWSLFYLKNSGLNLSGLFKGWRQIFNISTVEKRTPISRLTLEYLTKVEARLWY